MAERKTVPSPDAVRKIEREYPDESDAEKYRLAQAQQLLHEFKRRMAAAGTMKELEDWYTAKTRLH